MIFSFVKRTTALLLLIFATTSVFAAEWQWSVALNKYISPETNDHPRAFLWIPTDCKQVRAVVVGQHNMLEEGILEHPTFRERLSQLGIATIWISPGVDQIWDPIKDSETVFNQMLDSLAEVSGYSELKYAPVIPIGHSAYASFPWNFAAQNNERTLAILSVHGDAPSTNRTGYGRPNLDWSKLKIDGIPGLMVEGEYEWWEERVQPGLNYKKANSKSCVSFLCDAGRGHFDISEQMVEYLSLFVEKAAQYRLPKISPLDKPVKLIPVNPRNGWLADRWHIDSIPNAKAAPYTKFQGNSSDAFWYFDKEMATVAEKIYARKRGKAAQYIGFTQVGKLIEYQPKSAAHYSVNLVPEADGVTFHLYPVSVDSLHTRIVSSSSAKSKIKRVCGSVVQVDDTTFTMRFYRMGMNNVRRSNNFWLTGSNDGDNHYKSTVQQFYMSFPARNTEGKVQSIKFESMPNVKNGIKSLDLQAVSSSGMPVYYYVEEGPAEIKGGKLVFTTIPPRTKFPVKVTVVGWQYGRSIEPKVQTAEPVTRSFYIQK